MRCHWHAHRIRVVVQWWLSICTKNSVSSFIKITNDLNENAFLDVNDIDQNKKKNTQHTEMCRIIEKINDRQKEQVERKSSTTFRSINIKKKHRHQNTQFLFLFFQYEKKNNQIEPSKLQALGIMNVVNDRTTKCRDKKKKTKRNPFCHIIDCFCSVVVIWRCFVGRVQTRWTCQLEDNAWKHTTHTILWEFTEKCVDSERVVECKDKIESV